MVVLSLLMRGLTAHLDAARHSRRWTSLFSRVHTLLELSSFREATLCLRHVPAPLYLRSLNELIFSSHVSEVMNGI